MAVKMHLGMFWANFFGLISNDAPIFDRVDNTASELWWILLFYANLHLMWNVETELGEWDDLKIVQI